MLTHCWCGDSLTSVLKTMHRSVDEILYTVTYKSMACPTHSDEGYTDCKDLEDAEDDLAVRLVAAKVTGPQAIRWMTRGVFIDEFTIRFPDVTSEQVKGWRHGVGEVPEAIVRFAYAVAPLGYVDDCRCGMC